VADFYHILLDKYLKSPDTVPHGREGIYNLENGEYSHYESAEAISKALVALGLGEEDTPSTFTPEEEKKYFGVRFLFVLWSSSYTYQGGPPSLSL
jgi:hypothetical protein